MPENTNRKTARSTFALCGGTAITVTVAALCLAPRTALATDVVDCSSIQEKDPNHTYKKGDYVKLQRTKFQCIADTCSHDTGHTSEWKEVAWCK
jgi:hypothetical protein